MVIPARLASARETLCSAGPVQALQGRGGGAGDHLSLSGFPVCCDLGSQLSLVI